MVLKAQGEFSQVAGRGWGIRGEDGAVAWGDRFLCFMGQGLWPSGNSRKGWD